MIKRLKIFFQTVSGGAVILGVGTLASRVVGLLRDRLFAYYFGASSITDIYMTAFRLPDLIFGLLALGALSASFVPMFIKLWHKDSNELGVVSSEETPTQNSELKTHNSHSDAWVLANGVLIISFLALAVLSGVMILFASDLVKLLAPGFNAEQIMETVRLTRLMLLSPLFFAISNVVAGVLTAKKRFWAVAFAPVWYNAAIIFGLVVLYPLIGLAGLAYGVLIGAALHMLNHLIAAVYVPWKFLVLKFWNNDIKKVFMQLIPRALGLGMQQVLLMVVTAAASLAGVGAITAYTWAFNIASMPVNLFGVSIAVASFPVLAEAVVLNNEEKFAEHLAFGLRKLLFWLLPLATMAIVWRQQVVRLLLGSGQFSWQDTILTSNLLAWFSVFMFCLGLVPLLARAFYAQHDTKTPVLTATFGFIITAGLAFPAVKMFGVFALAFLYGFDMLIQAGLMFVILAHRKKFWFVADSWDTFKLFLSAVVSAGLSAMVIYLYKVWAIRVDTFYAVALELILACAVGLGVYATLCVVLKIKEVLLLEKYWHKMTRVFGK